MNIPTPIPMHLVKLARRMRRASLFLTLYRIGLIFFGAGVMFAALSSNSVFIAAVASIALYAIIVEDIAKTASDIWNANFYELT